MISDNFLFREDEECSPPCHRIYSPVSLIWKNHRGQHIPCAMGEPCPGKATLMIMMMSALPEKYDGNILIILILKIPCYPGNGGAHL